MNAAQRGALNALLKTITLRSQGRLGYDKAKLKSFATQLLATADRSDAIVESDVAAVIDSHLEFGNRWASIENFHSLPDLLGQKYDEWYSALVTALDGLPYTYELYIPLRGMQELRQREVALGRGVWLVDGESDDRIVWETQEGAIKYSSRHERDDQPQTSERTRYLRIAGMGFLGDDGYSDLVRPMVAKAKQIIHLGLQSGVFELLAPTPIDVRGAGTGHASLSCTLAELTGRVRFLHVTLGRDLMTYFHRVAVNEDLLRVSLPNGRTRPTKNASEFADALKGKLKDAIDFVSLPANHSDALTIRAAIEWNVDAAAEDNETVSFLQRCIGLEALLGTADGRGVTERLSDRYAYLIGTTESQRVTLRKEFVEMYGHRSNIVHARVSRLAPKHKHANLTAERMLNELLKIETKNLLAACRQQQDA